MTTEVKLRLWDRIMPWIHRKLGTKVWVARPGGFRRNCSWYLVNRHQGLRYDFVLHMPKHRSRAIADGLNAGNLTLSGSPGGEAALGGTYAGRAASERVG